VMFGLWGIFALYQLVLRVWDEQRALASAAVMAVLPGSIFIERSFLPDPAMVALVTTSIWLLVAYLQTDRWHYLILASVIGAWGFLTKITGLIIGIPMLYAMLAILSGRRVLHPPRLATLGTVAVFGLVPVVAYYLWARHLALSYPPYHFAGSGNWLWDHGLREWWNQSYFLPRLYQRFSVWMWTAPVIALVLLGLLCPFLKRGQASWADKQEASRNETLVDGPCKAPWIFHWWLLAGVVYYLIGAEELVNNPWNFHIIDPAAAALAGHGIVVLTSFTTRLTRPFISAGVLLVIAVSGQRGLTWMYKPYAEQSYKLGLALRQVTRRGDLVVTVANAIGDPTAIYYSGRLGWVFPPASVSGNWIELPENDEESIRFFEALRLQGAGWLGIVAEQKKELWQDHPRLVSYIQRTCEFMVETPDYVIYQIRGPEKAASARNRFVF
jgi:4-amino-4-deoxy-L-arabinose transferase-like glycosyltransferase